MKHEKKKVNVKINDVVKIIECAKNGIVDPATNHVLSTLSKRIKSLEEKEPRTTMTHTYENKNFVIHEAARRCCKLSEVVDEIFRIGLQEYKRIRA